MKSLVAAAFALLALLAARSASALDVHDGPVARFIDQMVEQDHFTRAGLERLLSGVTVDPEIIAAIERPAEALPWHRYRDIFVTPARVSGGRIFLATQADTLADAERRYGVQPAVVAALLGMESFYGAQEGSHSALTALATLAFDYPPRATFFRKELGDYLVLCRRNHFDPATLRASYAGALGAGQFMPSSYLAYAVDGDGKGSNLFGDWQDIVPSIANFLAAHGWRADQPVAAPAGVPADLDVGAYTGHSVPARTLRAAGIVFDAPVSATAPTLLVQIHTARGTAQYWVGLPNFLVLMSYNHSEHYALAAAELAGAMAATASPATAAAALAGDIR